MPPKTTKQLAAHAKKVVEDKTFGMKNKNRSAKVQQQIQHLTESVKSGSKEAQKKQAELAEKKSAKQAKLEFEAEMARLFKVAEDKKKSDEAAAAAAAAGGAEGDEGAKVGPDGEYLWQAEDFEEVAADETRLEEQLEAEREALKLRTDLTPVTEESFRAWRQRKIQEAADAEAARLKKAKEGAGKLKGWDLWQDNADLFVDDEEAEAVYEREFEEEPAGSILDSDAGGAKHVDPMAE